MVHHPAQGEAGMTTHAEAAAALRQVADQLDTATGTFGGVTT
jgi:hypothetical protein